MGFNSGSDDEERDLDAALRTVLWCAIGCALALLGALAVALVASCAPASDRRAAQAAKSAAYSLELDACIQNGHTYAEYEACAQGVDARYGVRRP